MNPEEEEGVIFMKKHVKFVAFLLIQNVLLGSVCF